MICVDVQSVAASRPGKPLFADLSVTVSTGDRIGVLGLNGSGKSTLLRVLTGAESPESGRVVFGRDVRVAHLTQVDRIVEPTALAAVEAVAGDGAWEAAAVLERLGMGPVAERPVAELSGGQVKRVALARALVAPSDLLVLDEPTNHLDLDAIEWLTDRLGRHRGALVLVTHDRHLLARLTTRVIEIDGGRGHVHDGGYDAYLGARDARLAGEAAAEASRRNLARRELEWLRRGAPARTSKSKAHLRRAREVVDGPDRPAPGLVRSGGADLVALGGDGGGRPTGARGWGVSRHVDTPRLGDRVVELHDVSFAWPGSAPLLEGVDLSLGNSERLGIVGPNGAGKSTLLGLLGGRLNPTAGERVEGSTVRIGYFDQRGPEFDESQRVRDVVAGPHRPPDWRDAAFLERFWFSTDAQWAPVQLLSGGERRRLQLLMVLAAHPNVLLLDEPTNDLDLDSLRLIEDFCEDWPGALVVVSHDRAFLDRTVDDVVVVDGTGSVARHAGGYAAWDAERRTGRRPDLLAPTPGSAAPSAAAAAAAAVGAVAAGTPAGASASAADAGPSSTRRGGRSISTIRHELRAADRAVAALTRQLGEVEERLDAAGASGDHTALAEVGVELASVTAELADAEERWLALAAEAEERGLHTG